jgi:hypothetical protein
MSSSVCVNNRGADHRANSAASYASDRLRQALRYPKIRIRLQQFINKDKLSHLNAGSSLIRPNSSCKPRFSVFSVLRWFLVLAGCLISPSSLWAENPKPQPRRSTAVSPQLAGKLTADFRTAIREKPVRESLDSLALALQINFWLDRHVDPSTPVASEAGCRNAFQVITSLASSVGLKALAVDNIVLVGRESWVEQTAGVLLLANTDGESASDQDSTVSWPPLTTPTQALAACGHEPQAPLPHDLWPAVEWKNLSRQNAVKLIAAQFDKMPSPSVAGTFESLKLPQRLSATYPPGSYAIQMRRDVAAADPLATVKDEKPGLLVVGSAAAHAAAIRSWLGRVDAVGKPKIDIDKVRFTLRIENAVAEQVFKQLASTADRQLVIDDAAMEACRKLVTLAASDATLRQLVDDVARSIGATIQWTENELKVVGPLARP